MSSRPAATDVLFEAGEEATVEVLSPNVGWVSLSIDEGDWIGSGQHVGTLDQLGLRIELVMPRDLVGGRVRDLASPEVPFACAYGDTLFRLEPLASDDGTFGELASDPQSDENALVVAAPQSGRFYRRPNPEEPEFLATGDEMKVGATVGLLEVMKTFAPVRYEGDEAQSLEFDRYLVTDGAEVTRGTSVASLRIADS